MREGITLGVGSRLEAVVADRNSPQKHVWRARIVLLAAEGLRTAAIMRQSGKSKNAVNRRLTGQTGAYAGGRRLSPPSVLVTTMLAASTRCRIDAFRIRASEKASLEGRGSL